MQEQNSFDRFRTWMRTSVTIRLMSIGFLVLLMLIPIGFVEELISDRQFTKQEAVDEISQKWGNPQTISGPIITVPYQAEEQVYNSAKDKYESQIVTKHAYLLPEKLSVSADVKSETRRRGIYEAVVYKSAIKIEGSFDYEELKKLGINNLELSKAHITQGVSDLRSLNSVQLDFDGSTKDFDPGSMALIVIESGISTQLKLDTSYFSKKSSFKYTLEFNGSQTLNFIPVGKETHISISADNPNPKFDGAFLPEKSDITKDGFTAEWNVFHLNRNYPQSFVNPDYSIGSSAFGVGLLIGVDEYQKNTRAAKYAVLIIILTFMTYFFMQTRNGINIHFIQYLLVGFALTVFYILLVSLSEHISFTLAYWIASLAVIGLITAYSHTMLKDKKLTLITGLIISTLYLFIFVIIQLQNYSLLVGSIGLFIVVALAMFASRNIDWYSLTSKNKSED